MSDQANVGAIQALESLRAALQRFRGESRQALEAVEWEITRTLDLLQERLNYWQRQVREAQAELEMARRHLAACEAQYMVDPRTGSYIPPDCRREQMAVREAGRRLRMAEDEVHVIRGLIRVTTLAVEEYHTQARRLKGVLERELPMASNKLSESAKILYDYASMRLGSPASPAAGSAPERSGGLERETGPEANEGGAGGVERRG